MEGVHAGREARWKQKALLLGRAAREFLGSCWAAILTVSQHADTSHPSSVSTEAVEWLPYFWRDLFFPPYLPNLSASHRREQLVNHGDSSGPDEYDKNPRENKQHQGENELHCCLGGFFLGQLATAGTH